MDTHVHVHALVPGGGPSPDGKRWIACPQRWARGRRRPYLVDNKELSRRFRKKFTARLKRLHRQGKITFDPPLLPDLRKQSFADWVDDVADRDWNVYIEPPPENSGPDRVLKYLARYLTGGPISDRRLISHEDGLVTFWARGKNKKDGNKPREFTLPGTEFVRRWALHILPKGFTKSRPYGGFSCTKRDDYLERCRALLKPTADDAADADPSTIHGDDHAKEDSRQPACPHCQTLMECIVSRSRPSWRDLFAEHATCPLWYQPWIFYRSRPLPRVRGP